MKLSSVAIFATLSSAAAVPQVELRDDGLLECCYTFSKGSTVAVFRTTIREGFIHSTPRPWCTATFARDENDLDNCFAATAKVYSGYCSPSGSSLTPVDCT